MTSGILRHFSSLKIILRGRRCPTINSSQSVYIMGTVYYTLWVINNFILNKVQLGNYTLA